MEYEGQQFQVSKPYSDWDEFREDPENYPDSETDRMTGAVESARLLESSTSREAVMAQMFEKQFPGFGCSQLGLLDRSQLDQCAAFSVEIPRTGNSRYAGYAKVEGRFLLVSDFVAPRDPMISHVSIANGHLNFHGMDRAVLHKDPIASREQAEQ